MYVPIIICKYHDYCRNYRFFTFFLVKKETLALQNYEATLLRYYKHYLQKLEKMTNILRRKKGDTRQIKEQEIELGKVALTCMCDLLTTHPYFNYSINIANFLIPLLDNKHELIRQEVLKCISKVFKEDKRAELSLKVRHLNDCISFNLYSRNIMFINKYFR